jgi:hypothetical protein
VRHRHTKYDELLMREVDRAEARRRIQDQLEDVVDRWGEQQAAQG